MTYIKHSLGYHVFVVSSGCWLKLFQALFWIGNVELMGSFQKLPVNQIILRLGLNMVLPQVATLRALLHTLRHLGMGWDLPGGIAYLTNDISSMVAIFGSLRQSTITP